MNLIGSVIQKSLNTQFNTLQIPTHETYQSAFAEAFPNHNHYLLYLPNLKTWDKRFRKLPENCHLLKTGSIPLDLNFNVIISQNFADQYNILAPLAKSYGVPLICITHTWPYPGMPLHKIKEMKGDANVFITGSSKLAWGWRLEEGTVIEHAIDCDVFKPLGPEWDRENYILSVCNQFNNPVRFAPCGFPLWKQIIGYGGDYELPYKHVGADCPGLGNPASSLTELISEYQKASIFINTSQMSPIPMSLLEAAACGCAILSTHTCEIPNIFSNNYDAILSDNPKELREAALNLLENPDRARKLGMAARDTIQRRFTKDRFRQEWLKVYKILGLNP